MENKQTILGAMRLFWAVRWFTFKDFAKTVFYFWRKPKFALVDWALLSSYFFQSPYRIARKFSKDDSPYGETPLVVMQQIANSAGITAEDCVYELGSGRGRTCFWLALYLGCETVGIEFVPHFVSKANAIATLFGVKKCTFRLEDMCKADLKDATVIYLFGTCLKDEEILKLIRSFSHLKKGTKIITISYALTEYSSDANFELVQEFEVTFPWGQTTAYLHNKTV
jgi:SAM-dependent methyltransferase